MSNQNLHIGDSFSDFLDMEGLKEKVQKKASRRVALWELTRPAMDAGNGVSLKGVPVQRTTQKIFLQHLRSEYQLGFFIHERRKRAIVVIGYDVPWRSPVHPPLAKIIYTCRLTPAVRAVVIKKKARTLLLTAAAAAIAKVTNTIVSQALGNTSTSASGI